MLDMALIRNTPGTVLYSLNRRQDCTVDLDAIRELDQAVCKLIRHIDDLRQERNRLAQELGTLLQSIKQPLSEEDLAKSEEIKEKGQEIKKLIQDKELELQQQSQKLQAILYNIPNLLSDQVPDKPEEIRSWGNMKMWKFLPKSHYDLLSHLLDFEAANRISGAKFVVLRQDLALLERALINFLLDHAIKDFEYTEVSIPYLVKQEALYGTGQLPKFYDDHFHTQDEMSLIPTAEVSLVNIVRDCLLEKAALPLRWVAHSPCFRREAGAAGRSTRGLIRQHQFHKVELVSIVTPESAMSEMERQVDCAERALQKLGLRYRIISLPAYDLGFTARLTYDLEVYLEGEGRYCEISSCSYCGDFQARRLRARYREALSSDKYVNKYVHTLNGSSLAVGRLMAAILESYQQVDGTVLIPEQLRPYMNNKTTIL